MKKKILVMLMLAVLLAMSMAQAAWAEIVDSGYCGTEGGNVTWTLDDAGTLTISGNGEMRDCSYPFRFWHNQEVKRVVIEEGVTTVGKEAFYRCIYIEEVDLPESLTFIGASAFEGCECLRRIDIPSGVKSLGNRDEEDGGDVFRGCSSLETIELPPDIEYVTRGTFAECLTLAKVTLPEGLKGIDLYAFGQCGNLAEINMPESLETIGDDAFWACKSLAKLDLPEGLQTIGKNAIYCCYALTSINIPASVTSLGEGNFTGCYNIEKIDVPENGNYIFEDGGLLNKDRTELLVVFGGYLRAHNLDAYVLPLSVKKLNHVINVEVWCEGEKYYLPTLIVHNELTDIDSEPFIFWNLGQVFYQGTASQFAKVNISGEYRDSVIAHVVYQLADVSFDPNGGSGVMPVRTVETDSSIALPECGFTAPEGQEFKAWQIAGSDYGANDIYTVSSDVTVKAIWQNKAAETETPADKIDKALQDILDNTQTTANEIKEVLENLANGDLKAIIKDVANGEFNNIFDKIEELENKIQGSATINIEAGLGFVDTSVKVVGAKLNFDYESNVRLDIGKPQDENIEVSKQENADLFRFSMQLVEGEHNNIAELTVPVRITLPMPGRNPNPQSIKLWHFHNGRLMPVEFTRAPFQENGQWFVTFKISGFSDFIIEYAETTADTVYTITFDTDGGTLAANTANPDYVTKGESYKMPGASKSGYTLAAWAIGAKTSENKVRANEVYTFTADTTVYALWERASSSGGGGGGRPATKPGAATETKPGMETGKPSGGGREITAANIASVFADVQNNAWYSEAIAYVYNNGIMNGTEEDKFEPNAATSRAMIVTMLHRLTGEPGADAAKFIDVFDGQWFSNAVAWAAANGVVNGYEDGRFAPNDNMTREQIAAILYRYADFKGLDVSLRGDLSGFADCYAVEDWAKEAVEWAVGAGLLQGDANGKLAPAAGATRAEVATIMLRFVEIK